MSFLKIFEKVIYSISYKHIYIYTHTCTNNIQVKKQYGFRIDSNTVAASYNVSNEILKAMMNNRISVRGIFCDLEMAFFFWCVCVCVCVCVNHGILEERVLWYA
jgi:hypothetical protein